MTSPIIFKLKESRIGCVKIRIPDFEICKIQFTVGAHKNEDKLFINSAGVQKKEIQTFDKRQQKQQRNIKYIKYA